MKAIPIEVIKERIEELKMFREECRGGNMLLNCGVLHELTHYRNFLKTTRKRNESKVDYRYADRLFRMSCESNLLR